MADAKWRLTLFIESWLLRCTAKVYVQGRHMWYDQQDLGLTSFLENRGRRRRRRRAAIIGVLHGFGARAATVAPLNCMLGMVGILC